MSSPNHNKSTIILAVESSCDETSAAICKDGKILSNVIATQKIHAQYGGVVPEVAARLHIESILPVVHESLTRSACTLNDVDVFAYTKEPGLIGCLLVGESFITALAMSRKKTLHAVHHIHAHVLANFIDNPRARFPLLCLCVSGGHTQIILAKNAHTFEIIGETLDDAAGEAFDKIATLLGLPYPGGKAIDDYAEKGNPQAFQFPLPHIANFDYSFSGLKTAVRYFLQKQIRANPDFINVHIHDLCASVRAHIVHILLHKFWLAAKNFPTAQVCIAGGVSANSLLRMQFVKEAKTLKRTYHIPDFAYCTDNAAMIAVAAYMQRKGL